MFATSITLGEAKLNKDQIMEIVVELMVVMKKMKMIKMVEILKMMEIVKDMTMMWMIKVLVMIDMIDIKSKGTCAITSITCSYNFNYTNTKSYKEQKN